MSELVNLTDLSAEQQLAVSHPMEPVAIIAGAGSGKTTVMSARVLHLINSKQVESEQILGLTFTNKAASQLRNRIAKQLGKDFQDKLPNIATYHSFARQLLIDHGAALGIEPDHRTLTDTARAQLALKVLRETKTELVQLDYSIGRIVEMLLKLDELLAEHLLTSSEVINFDNDWAAQLATLRPNDDIRKAMSVASQRIELLAVVEEFRSSKAQLGLVDFADQMRLAVELLQVNPDLAANLKMQYKCVLLDEYQDTSVAQQQMLLLAFGDGHSVTAVGDPLQSIYAWRGASAETTRSFPYLFPTKIGEPAKVLSLSENYRSAGSILEAANQLIAPVRVANPGAIELKQGNLKFGRGEVAIGCFEKAIDEVAGIVEQIKSLLESGAKPDDIAVLGRTSSVLLKIHEALTTAEIPAALIGVETISKTPEVVEIISLIEAAADPLASAAVARLLISPRLNIGDRDLAALAYRAGEIAAEVTVDPNFPAEFQSLDSLTQASLADALSDLGSVQLSAAGKLRMQQLAADIESIRNVNNAVDAVWKAVLVLNMDIELFANPTSRITQRSNVVAGFVDLVRTWSESTDDPSVAAFIAWIKTARRFDSVPKIEVPLVDGAISLLTIHRAKGLEWPHVFVPDVTKTVFPSSRGRSVFTAVVDAIAHSLRGDRNSLPADPIADRSSLTDFKDQVRQYSLEEELRLAYVAITRAQSTVTITTSWWGDTQKQLRGPSVIYNEIAATATKSISDFAEPDLATNPYLEEVDIYRTQANPNYRAKLKQVAAEVVSANTPHTPAGLSATELQLVAAWDTALDWLLTGQRQATVELPNLVTASNLIKAIRAPEEFANALLRPMPAPPSRAALSGTSVHLKIENYYKQATLIDIDDLLRPAELSDQAAQAAFEAFENSKYADLKPTAIEWSFQLPVGDILVPGRIDAIYELGGKSVLVDWKTGNPKHADQLQLAIYKMAWAQLQNVELKDIAARFVFLPDLIEVEATADLSYEQLYELLLTSLAESQR
jgi:DNA helicase II / ATP-dependent DNA helicase PcrA